jgi:hypothetical protein
MKIMIDYSSDGVSSAKVGCNKLVFITPFPRLPPVLIVEVWIVDMECVWAYSDNWSYREMSAMRSKLIHPY